MEEDITALPYKPSEWHELAVPEDDAALALENNDFRLLAFALRTTNVPGVQPGQIQTYREQCGLRYLKGFGDVVRSTEDLGRMKLAREYALRYNTVITSECSLSD